MAAPDRVFISKIARVARGGVIDVAAASRVLQRDRRTAALRLAALARRGWLIRARRGLYLVLPLEAEPGKPMVAEDAWILAREAFKPCYIGGWSAAEHWGLTEQLFRSTVVVTAANVRSRSVQLLGHQFRLFTVPERRIRDLAGVWRGSERVLVSSRERTLVDCLRRPELCGGIRNVLAMMQEYASNPDRDFDLLIDVAKKFGNGATWKRLGFLAEVCWPKQDALIRLAKGNLSAGYTKLDPDIPKRGRLLRRWRLWVNTTIQGEMAQP